MSRCGPVPRTSAWATGKPIEKQGTDSNVFPFPNTPVAGCRDYRADLPPSWSCPLFTAASAAATRPWSKLLVWNYGSFQKLKSLQRGVLTSPLSVSKLIKTILPSSFLVSHGPSQTPVPEASRPFPSPKHIPKGLGKSTRLQLAPHTPLPLLGGEFTHPRHKPALPGGVPACFPKPWPPTQPPAGGHPHHRWEGERLLRGGGGGHSWSSPKKGRPPLPSLKQPPRALPACGDTPPPPDGGGRAGRTSASVLITLSKMKNSN